MLAKLCAGSSLKRLPWQPLSAASLNTDASMMAVTGGDGELKSSALHSPHETAAFCCAGDEEGLSPFLRQHPPPHMLLGSFLQLCRVTSMPGCNQDLGRDPASLISWANLFQKEPAGFRAARTKAFSSAK